jgi:predicted CopG family antitoxin
MRPNQKIQMTLLALLFSKTYLCTHTHTWNMATKTISITQEAYQALLSQKQNKESFTQTILRITKKTGKISDCFGSWKITDEEEKNLQTELALGWRKAQERMSNQIS